MLEKLKAQINENPKKAMLIGFAILAVLTFVVSPSQVGNDGSGGAPTPSVSIK